jgi:WD40 repeat protein
MKIKVKVTPRFNTGLLWLNNHLFVVSQTSIKQFDASTGSVVSEWPIRHSNGQSCIALPKHGQFIVYSTNHTVMLWDTSTHTTLGAFHHFQELCSVAISPDDRRLAIGEEEGNITIKNLPCVNASQGEQEQDEKPSISASHGSSDDPLNSMPNKASKHASLPRIANSILRGLIGFRKGTRAHR